MDRILKFSLILILSQLTIGFISAQTTTPKWHTRYKPAADEARAQKKNMLIVFTGSKWIDICRTFETDILQQSEFMTPASSKYVLLKLEFPKDNRLPRELAKEYQLLKNAYRVRGFPTVMATDEKGLPFGMNGYQSVTASEYAKVMLAIAKGREIRDAALTKAASQGGVDKAKTLISAVPDLPGNLSARYYRKTIEEIIALDPGNKTGMSKPFERQLADVDYSSEMQKLAAGVSYDKMIDLTDDYISKQGLKGELLQKALLNKLGIQQKQKNNAGIVQTLLEVVKVDQQSHFGKSAQKMLDNLRAQRIQEKLAR